MIRVMEKKSRGEHCYVSESGATSSDVEDDRHITGSMEHRDRSPASKSDGVRSDASSDLDLDLGEEPISVIRIRNQAKKVLEAGQTSGSGFTRR